MRVCYLILSVGLAVVWWPSVLQHSADFAGRLAIQASLLAGLGLLCALGLRYPLKMVPLLLFEFAWKIIYLLAFALPAWRTHQMSDRMIADTWSVAMVVIFLRLVPWRHVWTEYVRGAGDRWR